MKKIGEYTARGTLSEIDTEAGNPQKIPLFDGSFKTAYRVKEFYVWGASWGNNTNMDVVGKLSKNDDGITAAISFLRADDDNQIAWAGGTGIADAWENNNMIVDPDNLIVEDLYVYARTGSSSTEQPINYLVIMEKYEVTDWQGALAMARDRAQGDL